ncbi:MAG: sortase [Anaerolineaceae bacterium]|nr:sortase [Anaerolineaceae bacterium]
MKLLAKLPRELYFLIAGAVLLVGGLVGMLFVFNAHDAPTPTPNPSTQSAAYDQSLVVPAKSTPTSQSAATATEPSVGIQTLNFDKYFVHASLKSGLETPMIPDRIVIPEIDLDAPVIVADYNSTDIEGETFGQWMAPNEFAAGWQPDSALLGSAGNTVINGHHNEFGEVFGRLVDLKVGDKFYVYSKGHQYSFIIANRMILQERFVDVATRLDNARWLNRTDDVRLTLVTCWPKISNTHRLILVARPVD